MQIKLAELMTLPILKPFSKKIASETMIDPYQSLTDHINGMKTRMTQVQERLQSIPVNKAAGEEDNSKIELPELFEDLAMGINLLETKLGGDDIELELHSNVEELENLLWTLEEQCGITPKLSEHEKEEPEHKEIVEQVEKESELLCSAPKCGERVHGSSHGRGYCSKHLKEQTKEAQTTTTVTTSPAAPAAPAAPTTPQTDDAPSNAPDDASPSCALCGGLTFADYAGYQNHMEYSHASDTMPTSPSQKNLPTIAASKKQAASAGETVTDETIEEGFGTPSVTPTPAPVTPTIQNVQPTDNDNLEVPTVMPSSPTPPGTKWTWDAVNGKFVIMPDTSNPGKTI